MRLVLCYEQSSQSKVRSAILCLTRCIDHFPTFSPQLVQVFPDKRFRLFQLLTVHPSHFPSGGPRETTRRILGSYNQIFPLLHVTLLSSENYRPSAPAIRPIVHSKMGKAPLRMPCPPLAETNSAVTVYSNMYRRSHHPMRRFHERLAQRRVGVDVAGDLLGRQLVVVGQRQLRQ